MNKTDARNRRKKTPRVFMPFLPAWVYLIDNSSNLSPVRGWPWLEMTGYRGIIESSTAPRKRSSAEESF